MAAEILSPPPPTQRVEIVGGASLVPGTYDEITLSYTGADLTTVVYKNQGTTIATLTLSYTLGNLSSVVRS